LRETRARNQCLSPGFPQLRVKDSVMACRERGRRRRVTHRRRSATRVGLMTDTRDKRKDAATEADEVQQLRARIKELEDQLQSRPTSASASTSSGSASGALKVLTGGLAAMAALMVVPTYLTLRRWVRWWLQ
jgi:hypothetical protein